MATDRALAKLFLAGFCRAGRRIAADEAGLRRKFWRKLKREAASIPFLEEVLTAYYCAFDRQTPLYVKVVLVGAIVYFVVPDDLIPDTIPVIGLCRRCRGARRGVQAVSSHIKPEHRKRRKACWRGCARNARSRPQHDFSHHLAVGDGFERGRDVGQRINRVHMRAELALRAPFHDSRHQGALRLPARA